MSCPAPSTCKNRNILKVKMLRFFLFNFSLHFPYNLKNAILSGRFLGVLLGFICRCWDVLKNIKSSVKVRLFTFILGGALDTKKTALLCRFFFTLARTRFNNSKKCFYYCLTCQVFISNSSLFWSITNKGCSTNSASIFILSVKPLSFAFVFK